MDRPAENPRWRAKIRRQRQKVGAGILALVIVPTTAFVLAQEPLLVIRNIPKLFAVKGETVEAGIPDSGAYSPSAQESYMPKSSFSESTSWSLPITSNTVPEPTSLLLMAPALLLLQRRKRA